MTTWILEVVAIVGATVHSLDGAPAAPATVLIEDGKLVAIGADVPVPDGARRIEAAGLHLMPGLIDGYVGHDPDQDWLYTQAGTTTVVDHGNELSRIFDQRLPRARDGAPGPWIVTAGAVIDGVPPATNAALVTPDENAVQGTLKTLIEQDAAQRVDFFAYQSSLPLPAWKKLVELVHAQKMKAWGTLPKGATLADLCQVAPDGLLFLDAFAPSGDDWPNLDLAKLDATIRELAAKKIAVVPLLRGVGRLAETPESQVGELEYLSPAFAGRWAAEWELRRRNTDAGYRSKALRVLEKQRALVKKLFDAGVTLVPASGAPNPWLSPGAGLVRELVEWQIAGIPTLAVLRAATSGNADAFGLAERCGRLAPGLVADLVLLRSDPELAVANLTAIEAVVVRGRYLGRAELDEKRAQLRARQQAALDAATQPLKIDPPEVPNGVAVLEGYAETATDGVRTAGERWAIVQEAGGATVFSGRRVVPGAGGHLDVDLQLVQRVVDGALESFSVDLRTSKHQLTVRGVWVVDQFRVERKLDGVHVDTQSTNERIGAVDLESVTSYMLLSRFERRAKFPILRFHAALELEVARWERTQDPQGWLLFRTPSGGRAVELDAKGALSRLVVQQGTRQLETRNLAASGPGFPNLATK